MVHVLQSYIGGRYTASKAAETFENTNPATGELISQVEIALEPEVDAALRSAEEGLKLWSAMSGAERGRILNKAARVLRDRNNELARFEVQDTGKPIQEAEAVDIVRAPIASNISPKSPAHCAASRSLSITPSFIRAANPSAYVSASARGIIRSRSRAGNPRLHWPAATP